MQNRLLHDLVEENIFFSAAGLGLSLGFGAAMLQENNGKAKKNSIMAGIVELI